MVTPETGELASITRSVAEAQALLVINKIANESPTARILERKNVVLIGGPRRGFSEDGREERSSLRENYITGGGGRDENRPK